MLPEKNIEQLHQQIATLITTGKQTAYKAVNSSMILTYWEIGRLIVEEEQDGKEKAQYGKYLLRELSKRLKKDFGSGYSQPNLRNFRQFYLLYPIRYALRSELTWTHYRLIMRVENPNARTFYEEETIKSHWDTRSLERQIHTFYYERLLSSSDKIGVAKEAETNTNHEQVTLRDFVKDPYVLEFLDIKPDHSLYESDLEQLVSSFVPKKTKPLSNTLF
jgi:hypothetical protein